MDKGDGSVGLRNRVVHQVRRFGGPEELEVVDTALPTAGPANFAESGELARRA